MRALPIIAKSLVLTSIAFLVHCGSDLGTQVSQETSSTTPGGVAGGTGSSNDGGTIPTRPGAGGGDGDSTPTGSGLPCDVQSVLADHCQSCHGASPQSGAPNSLMTWDDLNAPGKSDPTQKEYQLVMSRTHDDMRPMPPPPNARLSAAEQATIDGWVSQGAPESTATCSSTPPAQNSDGTTPMTCTPDLHFAPPTPYTMPQNQLDEYVCYGVDVPATAATHIVAFGPKIDNKKIVHHMLLFRSTTAYSTTPTACSAGGSLDWSLMFGWAPGGQNMYLPPEAGYPLDPTAVSHFIVQVHYNNAQALSGEQDSSGMDLCTGPPRPNEADVIAFGSMNFSIPPNGSLTQTCTYSVDATMNGRTFVAAMPHMHKLGTLIDTHLMPKGGGTAVDMGTVANWDFQNQTFYPIQATVKSGDTIVTHCGWKNTTSSAVTFGENTENEMCYSFSMYYPKINSAFWSWASPSILASCK